MISFEEDDEIIGKAYDREIVRRLSTYLRPHLRLLALGLVFVLGLTCLEILGPIVVRYAIDNQIAQGRADQLGLMVLAYLGIMAGLFILRFAQVLLMTYVGQRVMMALRVELFAHLQRTAIAYFDRNPVGRLVTRLTNDISTLEMVISQGVVEISANLLLVAFILIVLFVLDWRLALVLSMLVPVLIVTVWKLASAQRIGFREQRTWLSRINAYLAENITGMSVIQLFNRQDENLHRFDGRNRGLLRANLRVLGIYSVFEPVVVLFNAVTIAVILWYGGGRAVQGALTLGTLVAFLQYMQRFYWPIRELADRYNTLQQAMASSERIFGVLDEQHAITDPPNPVHLEHVRGKIEFRNVWFAYDPGNWVIQDLSFVVNPGEKIAIVGATGAGKSTLMNLLCRFYDIQRGQILLDDVPINAMEQQELRRHVRIVLQDPFLFTDTVEENVRLRDSSVTRERLLEAAHLVGADEFISHLPDGWNTLLAERGANLSVGQKQLLALARAAAFDPEIVLVLDEATANVDPISDEQIQRSMRKVMEGRTSIIIAHRLNTIQDVDWILVLQHGQVIEKGTHSELLAQDGVYAKLYELQYRSRELRVL
jgi:ATP-binding cassette, subfamily B, multidrug efflux pump